MRWLFFAATLCFTFVALDGQSVSLSNTTHPYTQIEVGDTVKVSITGAAHNGTVTVVQNGNPPYVFGTTDANGNWTLNATETSVYVGSYTQIWYVNGVQLTPSNPNSTYLPWAPRLPSFQVFANFSGSNCSGQSVSGYSCMGNRYPAYRWLWTPVDFYSESSFAPASSIAAAANAWNWAQNAIELTNEGLYADIIIYDVTSLPGNVNANTISYSFDCNDGCYGYTESCTGECLGPAAVWDVDIALNTPQITASAAYLNANLTNLTTMILTHEFGHALRLTDEPVYNYTCSEAQSVMYPSSSVAWECGRTAPTSCDASGIHQVYPYGVVYCDPYDD